MSKLKIHAKKSVADHSKFQDKAVINFMDGTSYNINPLDTLKIIAASSIFGEPSYYRSSHDKKSHLKGVATSYKEPDETTTDLFTKAIDAALDYDFKGVLDLAVELRRQYFMRFNPSVILVRASLHKGRIDFNKTYGSLMRGIGRAIIQRPDDITNQFEYYMYLKGSKNNLPGILKRVWADRLSEFDRYQISKYQSKSLRDLVRISHAHSSIIDELMKLQSGVLPLEEDATTWERLRSDEKSWKEIWSTITIPHMALLRNLRGIFTEIEDTELASEILIALKEGVCKGKQFPFRYYTALKFIESEGTVNHKGLVLDALEECIDKAMENFPKLKGRTICLSDNSGSAWEGLTSEYGSTCVAEIDNLSSIMTAYNSDEGEVGIFGDELKIYPVSKRNGILTQLKSVSGNGRSDCAGVGGNTENGIWIFFRDAISKKIHYDNIFIYSDQQAGHGDLYGVDPREYKEYAYKQSSRHIDVLKLVQDYREKVNSKVNIFSIQTAGYDNSVLPENLYRGTILTGWTGKEAVYAHSLINIWNDIESRKQ